MKTEKKRGAERTQRAVRDEWWTDERVRSYLEMESSELEARDFHILVRAYRGMVPESFTRFIDFFIEDGHNINEKGPHGETILDIVSQHRNSGEYRKILEDAGAQMSAH